MKVSRRHFMYGTLLAGAIPRGGFGSVPSLQLLGYKSPNNKLNVAGIGVGGRGGSDLGSVAATENVVALCDVDQTALGSAKQRYASATSFSDFRQMLDKAGKGIDAVTIGTPDHTHAIAALSCMQLGKHVYVEKPLVRTPWEARILAQAAAKYKVATQMGNQGYSHEATRMASEIIWSGEIGDVTEVHAYRGRAGWPQGAAMQKIPPPEPVPPTLNWDAWLGPAEMRPYTNGGAKTGNGFYLPFNWRGHFDFGTGGLIGDWGIHILGPANMGLRLGAPLSVECVKQEGTSPFAIPDKMHIRWEFPARGTMPPVTVHWYVDYPSAGASDAYLPPGMTVEQVRAIPGTGPEVINISGGGGGGGGARGRGGAPDAAAGAPGAAGAGRGGRGGGRGAAGAANAEVQEALAAAGGRGRGGGGGGGGQGSGYNQIFVGSKGYLGTNGRGEGVGLIPGERWAKYSGTPRIQTRSPGHHRDWIRACKGGDPACSDFAVSGPYTEWVSMGAVALRAPGKLMWDAANCRFTGAGSAEANKYVRPFERKGWEMKL
jgi:predicted dehydrogenase